MGRSRDLADGTLAELNVDSNTLAVDATNDRVGIGTSSPTGKLTVDGGFLQVDVSGTQAIRVGSTDNIVGGTDNDAVLQSNTGKNMRFLTGGSERMRIDSSGRVTMPYQPMASVYSSTGGFTGSTGTVIPFNNEQVDVGGNYNTSTYRFTAPVAGKYFATVWYLSRNNTGGNCIGLYKNGTQVRGRGSYSDPGSGNEIQGIQTLIIDCAANDYIDARVTQYHSGDFYLSDLAGMQIYLIG